LISVVSESGAVKVEVVGPRVPEEPLKSLIVVMQGEKKKIPVVAVEEGQQTMQLVRVDRYQKRFSLLALQGSEKCCRC